nr:hypothetical protein [Tanacetum cinerariifolium]
MADVPPKIKETIVYYFWIMSARLNTMCSIFWFIRAIYEFAETAYRISSPDEHMVAFMGADEQLLFWKVFGISEDVKPTRNTKTEPFSSFAHIR